MPNLCISRTLTFLQPSFYWLLLLLEIVAARSPHRADLVHGDAGVEIYLRRYGWLAPVAWEKMPTEPAITSTFDLERLALPEILEGGETSRTFKWKHRHLQTTVSTKTTEQPKIREDLLPALQRFQQANSIPVTGRLDSETLSFLNSPRCGVPDHLLGLTAREEDEKEDGNIAVVDDETLDGIGEVEAAHSDDEALDGIGNGDDGELVGDGDDHRAEAKVKIKNKIQDDVITSSDELVLSNPEFSRDASFNKTSETRQPNMANTIFHKTLPPQSNITDIVDVEEGRNQTDEPMMRQNYTWGQPVQNDSKDDSSSMQKANYSEENIQWENDKTTYPPTMDNPTTQSQSFTDSTQTKQTREDLHHSTDGKSRRDVNSQKQSNIGRIRLKRKLQWLQEKPVRTRRTLQKTNEEEEINTNVMQSAERKQTKRALLGHRSGGQVVFGRRPLRWRLIGEGYSSQLSIGEQRQVLKLAFRMWSEVAPVEFQEDLVSPPAFVDIKLGFGTGRHLGCVRTFDGFGHEFAHAWRLGDVHFDDDENFSLPNSPRGINLLKVAVHEIGHVLGLQHVMTRNSVMQPRYLPHNGAFELDAVDRKHVQHMYGICNSPFDTIFDWVRSERQPDGRPVIFFNTYIFRNSWYWMYENRKGRPRHGDPLPISAGWPGLPISQIDGFAHVWMGSQDCTYFFKGAYYWRYDNSRDQVYSVDPEGVTYPRLIPEEFPGVPYPIDTVYFDHEDRHLYFFKENNVTAFDIYKRRPVFGHPIPLVSLFLPVRPGDHPFGGLDAAYYSYSLGSLFLLKNSQVWQVVPSRQHPAGTVTPHRDLLPGRSVSDTWKDVCDVHISMLNMA